MMEIEKILKHRYEAYFIFKFNGDNNAFWQVAKSKTINGEMSPMFRYYLYNNQWSTNFNPNDGFSVPLRRVIQILKNRVKGKLFQVPQSHNIYINFLKGSMFIKPAKE